LYLGSSSGGLDATTIIKNPNNNCRFRYLTLLSNTGGAGYLKAKIMKKSMPVWAATLLLALACNAPSYMSTSTTPIPTRPTTSFDPLVKPGWTLVFHDEFDRPALTNEWVTEYPWGRVNPPELQFYVTDAFDLTSGTLRIKAEKRPMGSMSYTSGLISSFYSFNFRYGYVESRLKVPYGKGLWPAFWLLDVSPTDTGEIDVLEILGSEPNVVDMSLHYPDSTGKSQSETGVYKGPDFSRDFHTFAVDWRPDLLIWYVDGTERYRLSQHIPQGKMYVIANLAVGGKWPGAPNIFTNFPAYFDFDYIRIYQHD
jgi:beta-glucanase (GH16 family)